MNCIHSSVKWCCRSAIDRYLRRIFSSKSRIPCLLCVTAAIFSSPPPSLANDLPNLDVKQTCWRIMSQRGKKVPPKVLLEQCEEMETNSKKWLLENWDELDEDGRRRCAKQTTAYQWIAKCVELSLASQRLKAIDQRMKALKLPSKKTLETMKKLREYKPIEIPEFKPIEKPEFKPK